MDRLTEQQLTKLVGALSEAFAPNGKAVREALAKVVNFVPEAVPVQFTDPNANPHYDKTDFRRKSLRTELAEDAKQAFFSEAYLYNLLGKEDARTLLARMGALCRALGVDLYDLYDLYPKEE